MYRVSLNGEEIGTTSLELADPPMGVVFGKVSFHAHVSPFAFFRDYCQAHNITLNEVDPENEFIDTHVIPTLHVFRGDGVEIQGQGCYLSGFKDEGY